MLLYYYNDDYGGIRKDFEWKFVIFYFFASCVFFCLAFLADERSPFVLNCFAIHELK